MNTRPLLCTRFVHDVPVLAMIHHVACQIWFYEVPLPAEVARRGLARYLTVHGALPVVLVTLADTFSERWDMKGLAATEAVGHIVDGSASVPAGAGG